METKQKQTYLISDGRLYKIGTSVNPESRLKQLKTANPDCSLVCSGVGVSEKWLHEYFYRDRIKGEWFRLTKAKVDYIRELLENKPGDSESSTIDVTTQEGWDSFLKSMRNRAAKLSNEEKKRNVDGKRRKQKQYAKYSFTFGKYSGVKITDMVSKEQIEYCMWLRKERIEACMSKRSMRNDRLLQIMRWWVGEVCKEGGKYYSEESSDIVRSKYSTKFEYGRPKTVSKMKNYADSLSKKYLRQTF